MAGPSHRAEAGEITREVDRHTLVERLIDFIEKQLPYWRVNPGRPSAEAEEQLNSQLCKFLNAHASLNFPMASFHHEERQGTRRSVDISAGPTLRAIAAMTYLESIYEPFLVLEGKRIPAPSAVREREYVTGFAKRSGGIQRFKLSLHGADHDSAVMIGYVQSNQPAFWWETMNRWIVELAHSSEDLTCVWSTDDQLQVMLDGGENSSRCESRHIRPGATKPGVIRLVHLWIRMAP